MGVLRMLGMTRYGAIILILMQAYATLCTDGGVPDSRLGISMPFLATYWV